MQAMPADVPVLLFDRVSFGYPGADALALDGVSFAIGKGEFVGVVGATGAGKSTLCMAVNGIVPQFYGGSFQGTVTVMGQDSVATPVAILAARVGIVFEDPEAQLSATTVENEVAFALENLCVPPAEIRKRVDEALAWVGLVGMPTRHPAELSGGQKQRLAIACALALSPDIIVLDEPTSQLDPLGTQEVFAILARIKAERGLTVLVASHASEELAAVADRILLLDKGKLVDEGPAAQLLGATALLRGYSIRPPDVALACAAILGIDGTRACPMPVSIEAALALAVPLEIKSPPGCLTSRVASTSPSSSVPALAVTALEHTYKNGVKALQGVDLAVTRGEFTALLGHNGSGKSTLIKHFLGLLQPSSGMVQVDGANVADLLVSELATKIGYIGQNADQQIFCNTVREEVEFALRMRKLSPDEIASSTADALRAMKIEAFAEHHPAALSRGDRLRVVIAAVLASKPEILVFDEPTTGQDWSGSLAILDILANLHRAGRTVVLVTHHLYLLPGYANRLVVMAGGKIVMDGTPASVFYRFEELQTASLLPPQTVQLCARLALAPGHFPICPGDLIAPHTLAPEAVL